MTCASVERAIISGVFPFCCPGKLHTFACELNAYTHVIQK